MTSKNLLERLKKNAYDTIIVNPEVLSDKYIPDELLFREKEMEQIGSYMLDFMIKRIPTNLFIWGPVGTGKTHAIQILTKDYNDLALREGIPSKALYLNAKDKSYFQVLLALLHALGVDFPHRGLGVGEAVDALDRFLSSTNESFIFIFDEVDKMRKTANSKEDPVDSLIYMMSRLDELASKPDVSLIIISNDNALLKRLREPTMSKFRPIPIYFRDYDADELKAILMNRVEKAFVPGAVEEAAISLLAALIKKEGKDLRWAFRVLLSAAKDKKRGEVIAEKDIWRAKEEVEKDILRITIENLNLHQCIVLWSIALLKAWNIPAMSGYVYEVYKMVCDLNEQIPFSMRHTMHYLTPKLETLGIITAKESFYPKSRGRALEFDLTDDPHVILNLTEKALRQKFEKKVDRNMSVFVEKLSKLKEKIA